MADSNLTAKERAKESRRSERGRAEAKRRMDEAKARPGWYEKKREANRVWREGNRHKTFAEKEARVAFQLGLIPREGCEVCGEHAEMHHDDYIKTLEIRWLCSRHHREWHADHPSPSPMTGRPARG